VEIKRNQITNSFSQEIMKKQAFYLFIISALLIFIAFHYEHRLSHFRSLGFLGIFLINLVGSATLFLPAPAIATVVAGGILYPPFFVALLASVGSAIGEMTGFLLGHSGKHVLGSKKQHGAYITIEKLFKQYGGFMIFVFGLIPNPFFDIIGIMAGALSYSPWRFLLYLFIGRFIRDIALAYVGAAL
jgi:membrane protein YqaA with SNARE-associated domain